MALTDTLTSGSSVDINVKPKKTGGQRQLISTRSFQVTAEGIGTLTFSAKLTGMTGFEAFLSLTGKTEIADLTDVEEIRLSAAGGNVTYVVAIYTT